MASAAATTAVLRLACCTTVLAALAFAVWPRLAATLLVYGLPARATVVALTWVAKTNGWDTHHVKFGPQAFEYDLEGTVVSASLAQFGVWVPLTIVFGTFAGSWFARRRAKLSRDDADGAART